MVRLSLGITRPQSPGVPSGLKEPLSTDGDTRHDVLLVVAPDAVAYVSKHRASSGQDAFTVHPIGNLHQADLGGQAGKVVPSAPGLMTDALLRLAAEAPGFGLPAQSEATHHGPSLESPTHYTARGRGA